MYASILYADVLSKAEGGEGSRGGRVIGHTSSGKPIYSTGHKNYAGLQPQKQGQAPSDKKEASNAAKVKSSHMGFTKKDHEDARDAHTKAYVEAKTRVRAGGSSEAATNKDGRRMHMHYAAARAHGDARGSY